MSNTQSDSTQNDEAARDANDERLRQEQAERWAAQDKYLNDLVGQESERNREDSVHMRWLEREGDAQLKWEELGRQMYDLIFVMDDDAHKAHLAHLERIAQAEYKVQDAERRLLDHRADCQRTWQEWGARDDERDFGF